MAIFQTNNAKTSEPHLISRRSLWNNKRRIRLVRSFLKYSKRLHTSYILILTEVIVTTGFQAINFNHPSATMTTAISRSGKKVEN